MGKKNWLISGASGNVGLSLLKLCQTKGVRPIAAMRRPRQSHEELADQRVLDFLKPETFEPALQGIEKVFLMRPPHLSKPQKDMLPFVTAMKTAGVQQVVFLSLQGADKLTYTPHHKIEILLNESGLNCNFLRPSFFMENLSTTHREEIAVDQKIMVPAGKGKTNFISVDDIALAAFTLLKENTLEQAHWEITGAESFDYYEVAEILSRELGKIITYKKPGIPRFIAYQVRKKTPLAMAIVMSAIYSAARLGKASASSSDFSRLCKQEAKTLADFIKENRDVWLNA